ncbi:aminodeoxychorismate lyase [Chryseobacterium sp. 6424]|nr:aminodeoxychorismate lyase [Chryseobacterium sp. 6424]
MNDFFVHYFFIKPAILKDFTFYSGDFLPENRAFLYGDAVRVSFFIHNSKLIMGEECYFFLMASMRKMRMHIPMSYTLEFFQQLIAEKVLHQGIDAAVIDFLVYRGTSTTALHKAEVSFFARIKPGIDVLQIGDALQLDLLKDLSVNTHLLSNIRVHSPENTYAEIYAKENDLDEVILLNPQKRIARSISGNLLFLDHDTIKIPKQSEGAYISPLMENFVTFVHKNRLAEIQEAEMIAFESQKAEEILLISDEKGVFSVSKIRNKTFSATRFTEMVAQWRTQFV